MLQYVAYQLSFLCNMWQNVYHNFAMFGNLSGTTLQYVINHVALRCKFGKLDCNLLTYTANQVALREIDWHYNKI